MGRKYQLGKRFNRTKYVCIIAEMMVMYVFHFLYQLFFPQWNGFALGAGFALVAAAIALGTYKLLDWCAAHMWYEVTEQGLRVNRGNTVRMYPWEDFVEAGVDNTNILARMPAWFKLKDGTRLTLEQYTEGLGSLILDILDHIEDHAEIANALIERLKTEKAKYDKYYR